jgi:hypothetical protein
VRQAGGLGYAHGHQDSGRGRWILPRSSWPGHPRPHAHIPATAPPYSAAGFLTRCGPERCRRSSDDPKPWAVRRQPAGKSGTFLLHRLPQVGQAGVRVRPLGGTRAGEVRLHRFLHNPRVTLARWWRAPAATPEAACKAATCWRSWTPQACATISLCDDGRKHSPQLHPTIAVDAADGALPGLVHAAFLSRDGAETIHCNKHPLAAKESRRWLAAIGQAGELRWAMTIYSRSISHDRLFRRPWRYALPSREAAGELRSRSARMTSKRDKPLARPIRPI